MRVTVIVAFHFMKRRLTSCLAFVVNVQHQPEEAELEDIDEPEPTDSDHDHYAPYAEHSPEVLWLLTVVDI